MKKGFTLAEIMIVLTVIAVLTAILLPSAKNAMPNEKIMKFKKAHNALYNAIQELVNTDEYYLDGNLGIKPDGSYVDNIKYFCNTLANIFTTKNINCSDIDSNRDILSHINTDPSFTGSRERCGSDLNACKIELDEICKKAAPIVGEEIVLSDKTIMYNANPYYHFAQDWNFDPINSYMLKLFQHHIVDGIHQTYKPFCIDIDNIEQGEDPFGYGIRVDGKIMNGARADEWLEKSIQNKD